MPKAEEVVECADLAAFEESPEIASNPVAMHDCSDRLSLFAVLTSLVLIGGTATGQQQQAEALIDRARAAYDGGRDELATALARRSQRGLCEMRFLRSAQELQKAISAVARQADPEAVVVQKALDSAAQDLVAAAKGCAQARWNRFAAELMEAAAELSPIVVWVPLRDQRKKLRDAAARNAVAVREPTPAKGELDVRRLLGEANVALGEKRHDEAMLALLEAHRGLRWVADESRDELRATVSELAAQAGSRATRAFGALSAAATTLQKIAAEYGERGWKRTAVDFMQTAQGFDAAQVAAALDRAREEAGDVYIGSLNELYEFFFVSHNVTYEGTWAVTSERVASPAEATGDAVILVSQKKLSGDTRIQLQAEPVGGPCRAGLIFGYKQRQDYHLLEVNHADDKTWIQLLHRKGPTFEKLAYGFVDMTEEERNGPIELCVEFEDGKIRAWANGREPLKADAKVEDFDGSIGLYVHAASTAEGGIVFRGLFLESL